VDVSDTRIFARVRGSHQVLVYEMTYAAGNDLAMVLPIPVITGCPENAVRFINLEDCLAFFDQLDSGFPRDDEFEGAAIDHLSLGADVEETVRILEVHDVGAYEASFVPTPADFGRLDERFRLPVDIWLELNEYRDYGFAVFKLRPTGRAHVHPMAFEFPTRFPQRLFFPTLHLHDRRLQKTAAFDHMLYCQTSHRMQWHMHGWEYTPDAASHFIRCEDAKPLFDPELPCWRKRMRGLYPNADCWIGEGVGIPDRIHAHA
jgi:hypothetical protein